MKNFLETLKETVNPATQPVGVNLIADAQLLVGKKIRVQGKRLTICQQILVRRFMLCLVLMDFLFQEIVIILTSMRWRMCGLTHLTK